MCVYFRICLCLLQVLAGIIIKLYGFEISHSCWVSLAPNLMLDLCVNAYQLRFLMISAKYYYGVVWQTHSAVIKKYDVVKGEISSK